MVVGDGLKGLPEAVESVWPQAWVQTCIVGLMRNSLHLVSYKDRKHVAAALKAIHRAVDEQAAALEDFEAAWAARYPGIPRMWRDAWEQVIPFLAFPPEIRTVIYTTNAIEFVNYQLRKVTKNWAWSMQRRWRAVGRATFIRSAARAIGHPSEELQLGRP